jgi:hypothetical protein
MKVISKHLNIDKHMVDVSLCIPRVLIGYRYVNDIDLKEYGIGLSDCDSALSYSSYDYGHTFELRLLGFGISVWWL